MAREQGDRQIEFDFSRDIDIKYQVGKACDFVIESGQYVLAATGGYMVSNIFFGLGEKYFF